MAEGVLVKGEYVYVFNNGIMKAYKIKLLNWFDMGD